MEKFTPAPDENVIFEDSGVSLNGSNGTAILTDKNLYHITYGMFGGVKNINKLPLRQIQIMNGQARVVVKAALLESPSLVVYSNNKQFEYVFYNTIVANTVKKWADFIANALTGQQANVEQTGEIAEVASQIKGTIDTFKGVFGKKNNVGVGGKVSKKCVACRAPISGTVGETVRCPYCDTEQAL